MNLFTPEYYEINDGRIWSVAKAAFLADPSTDEDYQSFLASGATPIKAPDETGVNTAEGLRQCLKFYGFAQGELESEEDKSARVKASAETQSAEIINAVLRSNLLQTGDFTTNEFATFAAAELYPKWAADVQYKQGDRIQHNGVVYQVAQDTTSSAIYPPDAEGVLAIYRPLSAVGSPEADGSLESPYAFISGMDCEAGKYYSYNGKVYKALQDMKPCVWVPGSAGTAAIWQLVE